MVGCPFALPVERGGGSGFCGVFVCVDGVHGAEIRAFNLSGAAKRESKGRRFRSGARAEQAGLKYSSSGEQGPAESNPTLRR